MASPYWRRMVSTLSSITARTLSTMAHKSPTSKARPAGVSDSKMMVCSRARSPAGALCSEGCGTGPGCYHGAGWAGMPRGDGLSWFRTRRRWPGRGGTRVTTQWRARRLTWRVGLVVGLWAGLALGAPPDALEPKDAPLEAVSEERPPFRALPAAVSVVPGLVLHGLGSLTAGDSTLAGRLFLLEGTGLGVLAAGGGPPGGRPPLPPGGRGAGVAGGGGRAHRAEGRVPPRHRPAVRGDDRRRGPLLRVPLVQPLRGRVSLLHAGHSGPPPAPAGAGPGLSARVGPLLFLSAFRGGGRAGAVGARARGRRSPVGARRGQRAHARGRRVPARGGAPGRPRGRSAGGPGLGAGRGGRGARAPLPRRELHPGGRRVLPARPL